MKKLFLLVFLLPGLNLYSQLEAGSLELMATYPQIKIGDTVPIDLLKRTVPAEYQSKLKGKLILLDWWSPDCSSCLLAMPKTDSLQKQFKDNVLIIPLFSVTCIDDAQKTYARNFWEKNKYTRSVSLPLILDTVLYKRFVHDGAPFIAWIDTGLVVRAFTWTDRVNARELSSFRSGQPLDWENVNRLPMDVSVPFIQQPIMRDLIFSQSLRSVATRYIPRIGSSTGFDSTKRGMRYFVINKPIFTLYAYANGFIRKRDNKMDIRFDSANFAIHHNNAQGEYYAQWSKRNQYCYEIYIPYHLSPDQQYQYVIDDLNKVFNLKAEILEEPAICAVLQEHPASREDGNYVVGNRDDSGDTVTFTSIDNLIYSIRDCLKYYPAPVFSAVKSNKAILVTIPWATLNKDTGNIKIDKMIAELNHYLEKSGYKLRTEQRLYPFLEIK